jgi:hypothetical protein
VLSLSSWGVQGIRPEHFAGRSSVFRFGRDPRGFDILPDIPGVANRLKAFFISRDDLIASKLATGRIRDLARVEDIRKAAESQRE